MLLTWFSLSILLSIFYAWTISNFLKNWRQLEAWQIPNDFIPKTKISIVLPIRNEAQNIEACLKSILNVDYPNELFEILIVEDHSEDETLAIIEGFQVSNLKIIKLADYEKPDQYRSFKKWGIAKAIEKAEGQFILSTDGDCTVPKNWLLYFASYFELNKKSFIAAPVNFKIGENALQYFQDLDMKGLMIMTGAGVHLGKGLLCNGANLGYSKKIFNEIDGFKGFEQYASGDDVFLLQKVAEKYPEEIGFIKNASCTVYTSSKNNWKDFISQRLRWATKTSAYPEKYLVIILGLIYLFHLSMVINLFLTIFFGWACFTLFMIMLILKICFDHSFLSRANFFFSGTKKVAHFFKASFIQIIYLIGVGAISIFKKEYSWKGRTLK